MSRATILVSLVLLAAGACATGRAARAAATLCVGGGPGCFATLQAAVDAAHDGDTIAIAPGTFAGGVTIDVSVAVVGAGSSRTTVAGGGPVLTIGVQDAPAEPTVSIRGITITGGLNDSHPDGVVTLGGGVWIPHAAGFGPGATVSISDSVVSGNRAVPQASAGFCGAPACAFAFGGGIANEGRLTLTGTRISGNQAGAPGSVTLGAGGGGIADLTQGSVVVSHSAVTGNRAVVAPPNGSFAEGGGIDLFATGAFDHSVVAHNVVEASGVSGEAVASAGGINVGGGGSLTLGASTVDDNEVRASAPAGIGGLVLANSGGIGVDGTASIVDSLIVSNAVTSQAPDGTVAAAGGGLLADSAGGVDVRSSLVGRNSIAATTAAGAAFVQGGGITNFGLMTLDRTQVLANTGAGSGPGAVVQGGGIWNSNFDGGPPTTPQLSVTDSLVAGNRLGGPAPQGGGLYTTYPVTRARTAIAGNRPDQCFGC
jgi:hypothetical protein